MFYNGYHFWGMHLVWWFLWGSFIFWIFVLPYPIPGQRFQSDSHLEILKKRFAAGEINEAEYREMRETLRNDLPKKN